MMFDLSEAGCWSDQGQIERKSGMYQELYEKMTAGQKYGIIIIKPVGLIKPAFLWMTGGNQQRAPETACNER